MWTVHQAKRKDTTYVSDKVGAGVVLELGFLDLLEDSFFALGGGSRATKVGSEVLALADDLVDCSVDLEGGFGVTHVLEHERGRADRSDRVGFALTGNVRC